MIKLVFFDWNGTILSDATANVKAQNKVLSMFNIQPITLKQNQEFCDIPITKFYSRVGIDEKMFFEHQSKIQETYHHFYEKCAEHCEARTGANVLLEWLRSKRIKSVILSNHTIESIERHQKRLNLEKYFDAILANDTIMSTGLKDKAERAEGYARENGFSSEQILVVGDSLEEAKIARQLGAKSVLVLGGWYSERRLKEAKPDYTIGRLDKLIGVIAEMQATWQTQNSKHLNI